MFFSTYVLTRRGPLAKVWLAAHWERKLTRNEVRVVDLTQTIVYIVHPVVPIALRTSGELLMGVVRIYALKVKHLLRDATEATMLLLRVSTTTMTKSGGGGGGGGLTSSKMTTRALTAAAAAAGAAGGDGDDEEGAAGAAAAATDAAHSTAADLNAITLAYAATGAATSSSSSSASAAAVVDRVAEALGEAHFRAVADLLDGGAYNNGGGTRASTRGAAAAAWYSMQPSSSSGGGAGGSGGYHDMMLTADGGVAQMRADLAALGERARSASTASSSNKSSLPSIEQGRGSAADGGLRPLPSGGAGADGKGVVAGDAAEVPYPSMYDDLDIGVALPDELPHALASLADAQQQQQQQQQSLYQGDGMPADLFAIPDLQMTTTNASATTAATAAARARKLRGAAVVDLAGTTLSRGAVERAMHERGDTLNHALRHGPHDVGERRAREVLARAGDPHDAAAAHTRAARQALHNASSGTLTTTALATDLERLADVTPLSTCIVSPVLRDGFAAALQASLSEALQHVVRHAAAARAARNDSAAGANKAPLPPRPRTSATADATDVPAADEEHMMMMMGDGCAHDAMMQPAYNDEHDAAWRKRSREALTGRRSVSHNSSSDDDGSGAARLSASAAHTLERLRTLLLASNAAADEEEQQQQRKRARADDTQHNGSGTTTTTLRTLCNGMRRRVAARTFVDVLALASQQLVDAHASRNGDEVLLSLRSRATMTVATAAAAA